MELAEELGRSDPLIEQLVLGLDGVLRTWEPTARTYVDHLSVLLAAQLARYHSVRPACGWPAGRPGLTARQLAAAREVMEARLAEPIPLADLAAAVSLSVSQFSRQFKASTGETPHRFLMRLRAETACRLLAVDHHADTRGGDPVRVLPPGAPDPGAAGPVRHHPGRGAPRRLGRGLRQQATYGFTERKRLTPSVIVARAPRAPRSSGRVR